MHAEVQPAESKQLSSAILSVLNWVVSFCVIKFGPDLDEALGTYSLFYTFAGISVVGTVATFFLLPETKGKSVAELRRIFVKDGGEVMCGIKEKDVEPIQ